MCLNVCACIYVCALCMCVPVQTQPPPLQLTGRWMLAVTPAWICSCQMWWGHRESTKTLINLKHCPAFCWSLPVVSNIYLVTADTGKSAYAHRKQVAKPTDLCCRPALGSLLLQTVPHCRPTFIHTDRSWLWSSSLSSLSLGGQKLSVLLERMLAGRAATWSLLYSAASNPNEVGRAWGSKRPLDIANQFCVNGWNFCLYIQKRDQMHFVPNKTLLHLCKPQISITFEKSSWPRTSTIQRSQKSNLNHSGSCRVLHFPLTE